MASDLKAQFILAGVAIGNVLTGTCPADFPLTHNVTLSGNPGITIAQAQTAKLRVWIVDHDGGVTIALVDLNITKPTLTYTPTPPLAAPQSLLLLTGENE